jgi:hypothetical protein
VTIFHALSLRLRGIGNISFLLRSNKKAFKSDEFYILPHLGYGDLICCAPIFFEYAQFGKKIHVFSPKNAIPLLENFCSHPNISYLAIEDCLGEAEFTGSLMIYRARQFARRRGLPVLYLGYDLLWLSSKIRPDLDIDSVFYRLARVSLTSHKNFDISSTLRKENDQFLPPLDNYALIDHFPGTVREIDSNIIASIESKGLKIIHNPRDVKYEKLVDLIENATELHLVNSSLLCLALLMNTRAVRKVVYPINKNFYPGLYFYDSSWEEYALNSPEGIRYPNPVSINRKLEHQKLKKDAKRIHKKFLDYCFFRNYPNPY